MISPTLAWAVGISAVLLFAAVQLRRRKRKRFAEYGYSVAQFDLPHDGRVEYARWQHPKEAPKGIDQEHVDALRRYIRPGDLVIDIGAHTGDTSIPMALAAGPEGCTLALEPNPYVFKILEKNATLNPKKTNIVPLNFAATDVDSTFTFQYSDAAFCNGGFLSNIEDQRHGHRHELEVQGRNLNVYLEKNFADRLDRLSFIKVDTEGYDRIVIESLLPTINRCRPIIVCEVLKRLTAGERHALHDTLERAGYDCFKYGDTVLDGESVSRDDMTRWGHFDICALPRDGHLTEAA